jgi:hypothetical protein
MVNARPQCSWFFAHIEHDISNPFDNVLGEIWLQQFEGPFTPFADIYS